MPTFHIRLEATIYIEKEVEANSLVEAKEIGQKLLNEQPFNEYGEYAITDGEVIVYDKSGYPIE